MSNKMFAQVLVILVVVAALAFGVFKLLEDPKPSCTTGEKYAGKC